MIHHMPYLTYCHRLFTQQCQYLNNMGLHNLFRFWLLDIFGRPAALYLGGAGVGEVVADDVHRQREDHSRVLLRADRVQGLRVRIRIPVLTKFECMKLYHYYDMIFLRQHKIFFLSLAWRYLSCSAAADSVMTSEACLSALLAFCSPSAAITCTVETLLLAFLKSTNLSHI